MPGILRIPRRSPKGVRDVVDIQQEESLKSNMMSPKVSHTKKTWRKKVTPVATSPKKKVKAASAVTTTPPTLRQRPSPDIHKEFQEVKHRLATIRQETQREIDELHERMVREKARIRKELRAKYEPFLTPDKSQDVQVRETAKIIQYLRDDNARIREEMEYHRKMIQEMKRRNAELEATNLKVAKTYESLSEYVLEMKATNAKLVKNSEVYKAHIKTMKNKMKQRDAYFEAEANTADLYEESISKIIEHLANHSKDANLTEAVIQDSEKAIRQADSGKKMELDKVGLTEVPLTRRRKDVQQQRRRQQQREDDDESDTEFDSDDEA